ncbi:MAG: T9SS type A sorting domain-containing protein [Bacteroidota bacterium]
MSRFLLLLSVLLAAPLAAQTVTVETLVPRFSDIDDALALGPDGALYGSRFGSFPTPVGQTVTRVNLADGSTSLHADGFARANGLAFRPDGTLFVANYNTGIISRVAPNGAVFTYAQADNTVSGLLYDAATSTLYAASYDGNWVRIVNTDGTFTDVVSVNRPAGMALDAQGRLHVAGFESGRIYRVENGTRDQIANLNTRLGFLAYGGGRFFATGIDDHVIYAITPEGETSTLAGSGFFGTVDGPGETARFNRPNGIVATADGDTLYVSEAGQRAVRRVLISAATAAEDEPTELGIRLLDPAPNPSAGRLAMRFVLGVPAEVALTIYDLLGRPVHMLASRTFVRGSHEVELDATALPSGAYFVVLRSEGETRVRRFVRS